MKRKKRESGQSTVEYLLVMAVVVITISAVNGMLKKSQFFFTHVTSPLVSYMRYNYKYADPQGQGWDEGSPNRHIQQQAAGKSFKLFIGVKGNENGDN